MSFDNLCKLLSEKHPATFASWVLGTPLQGRILHLEFQTKLESTPPLPLRMLDYWVRLYRLYRLPKNN
jgi:predicted transposase YdaD